MRTTPQDSKTRHNCASYELEGTARFCAMGPANLPRQVAKAIYPDQDTLPEIWPDRDLKSKTSLRELRDCNGLLRPIIAHEQGRVPSSRI